MTKFEVFMMLRRNGHKRRDAIIYISDFLGIKVDAAKEIYEKEFIPWMQER